MDSDGEQNSPEGGGPESYEKFRGQRRNTDFSQADNDLKRFLSEREENKEGSNENIQPIIRWEKNVFQSIFADEHGWQKFLISWKESAKEKLKVLFIIKFGRISWFFFFFRQQEREWEE